MKRQKSLLMMGVVIAVFLASSAITMASMLPGSGHGECRGIQFVPNYTGYWSTGLLHVDVGAPDPQPVKLDLLLSEGVIEQAIYAGEGNPLTDQNENLFHGNKGVYTIHYTADGEPILNMIFITEYHMDMDNGAEPEWVVASEFVLRGKFEVYGDVMTIIFDLEPDYSDANGGGNGVFDDTNGLVDGQPFDPNYDFVATLYRQ